jgi:rhodanese-related sulfurtransferase
MKNITVEELKSKIDAQENLHLVDVREPHEQAEFNIGGTLLSVGKIQSMMIEDIEHLKNEPVICYCRSGQRSMMSCLMLDQFGFTDVTNLTGGMLAWREKFGG